MKRHIKWLLNEIDRGINEGIIDSKQGNAIKIRCPAPGEGPAWGRAIEKCRGNWTDVQIPLEMEIAASPGGKAVIRGYRWSPLGKGIPWPWATEAAIYPGNIFSV